MAKILIIDDDKMICSTMSNVFTDMGYDVTFSLTLKEGLKKAHSGNFDVVFLDVQLPDGLGLEQLPAIQATPSSPEVIIITGYADPDGAELAIKNNAWDYLKKPASIDSITLSLTRALQYREEKKTIKSAVTLKREEIIGNSPSIKICLDLVAQAAGSMTSILISGETGTGKELFARAIHENSHRADKNFVVVDCGSLPETLIESLLFGHTKGAFTGATSSEVGYVKHADGGTLFLDEVGELPMSMQKAFLRVLQEKRFHPIGGTKEVESDFRLVAATNRNLDKMVEQDQFRSDLLFRLRSLVINLPPLRERPEDIKEIAVNQTMKLCETNKIGMKGLSPELIDVLNSYQWPGNIRELCGALEVAITHGYQEPTLFSKHLPTNIRVQVARSSLGDSDANVVLTENRDNRPKEDPSEDEKSFDFSGELPKWQVYRKSMISEGETRYLKKLINQTSGNIKSAAKLSGLSQPRLYELLRKYQIST